MDIFRKVENKRHFYNNSYSTGSGLTTSGHGYPSAHSLMKNFMGRKMSESPRPSFIRLDSTGQVASEDDNYHTGVTIMPGEPTILESTNNTFQPSCSSGSNTGFFNQLSFNRWLNHLVSKAQPCDKNIFCSSKASPYNFQSQACLNSYNIQHFIETENNMKDNTNIRKDKGSKPLNPNAKPWFPPNFFCYQQPQVFQGPVQEKSTAVDTDINVQNASDKNIKRSPSELSNTKIIMDSMTCNNSSALQQTLTLPTTCDIPEPKVPLDMTLKTEPELQKQMFKMTIFESPSSNKNPKEVPCEHVVSISPLNCSLEEKPLFLLASVESNTSCVQSTQRVAMSSIESPSDVTSVTLDSVDSSYANIDPAVFDLFENMSSSPVQESKNQFPQETQNLHIKVSSAFKNDVCPDNQFTAQVVLTRKADNTAKKKNRPSAKRRRRNKQKKGSLPDSTDPSVKKGKVSIYVQSHPDQPMSPLLGSSPVNEGSYNLGNSSPKFAFGFLIQAPESDTTDSDDSGWDDSSDDDQVELAAADISFDSFPSGGLCLDNGFDFHITCHMNDNTDRDCSEQWSNAGEELNNSLSVASQEKVLEANRKWAEVYDSVDDEHPDCKIQFKDELTQVYPDTPDPTWSPDYAAARKGPWEEYARDRARFRNRIQDVGKVIAPCLIHEHRQKIWKSLADTNS